ncbi:zinc ribbon domain-containing protein, partial [Nitrosopumilus sp.]|nr:zinc ribbon domain-containing protein [Nitrosopumilus sp.]
MKFCSNCGKKIERNVDITTKIVKCSNCGRVVDSQIKGEIIDSKIREEWNVLLEKYLIKLSERRIRDFEEKINFYKLKYLKKNILGMGHEEKIVNEISDINSILWIKAIMNKPIELKNITRINDVLDY